MKKKLFIAFIFCMYNINSYAVDFVGRCIPVPDYFSLPMEEDSCNGTWASSTVGSIDDLSECEYKYSGITCDSDCHINPEILEDETYTTTEVHNYDFCLSDKKKCEIKGEGNEVIGNGTQYWKGGNSTEYTQCYQQNCIKDGYHYEKTGSVYIDIIGQTIEYGECVINEEPCADYFERKASETGPTHFYICNNNNSTIEGTRVWLPDDPDDAENYAYGSGSWNYDDCTCTYTTDLEWNTTTRAEIICKYYPGGTDGTPHWYQPGDQTDSNKSKCYVKQALACNREYCILEADGKECKKSPSGYYHANNTDTQCKTCPAGTTSDEGADTAEDCYVPTGATFTDSNGSFSLGELGATDDIFFAQ